MGLTRSRYGLNYLPAFLINGQNNFGLYNNGMKTSFGKQDQDKILKNLKNLVELNRQNKFHHSNIGLGIKKLDEIISKKLNTKINFQNNFHQSKAGSNGN